MSDLPPPPNFNPIARLYRWLEYLAFGPFLSRTRNQFLPRLKYVRRALVLGDGDGRFTAALLAAAPSVRVTAVDAAPTMLKLLTRRCRSCADRLTTIPADARTCTPAEPVDLIATHFFFDCLTQPELDVLVASLAAHLRPRAYWVVSDFRIPRGPIAWPARLFLRLLYFFFRIVTGLRVTRLPDHATPLRTAGFIPVAIHRRLFGLLSAELWKHV